MDIPLFQLLADTVLLVHLAFIVFVLLGGLLLLRWPRLIWLHLPALIWAVLLELTGWLCPLTPLENFFRALAGGSVYQVSFIERYLLPLVYPAGLTPFIQMILAGLVILINVIVYTFIIHARKRARKAGQYSSR